MALVLLGGLLYLYLVEQRDTASFLQVSRPGALLPDLTIRSVTKIRITHGAASFELEKQSSADAPALGERWVIFDAPEADLDQDAVREFLQALATSKAHDVIKSEDVGGKLDIFGFAPPALSLTIRSPLHDWLVSFGKRNSVTGRRYVHLEGDNNLYLVMDTIFQALNKTAADLRDKTPLHDELQNPKGIVVTAPRYGDTAFESRDNRWLLRGEAQTFDVDEEILANNIANLRDVRVKQFIDNPDETLVQRFLMPELSLAITPAEPSRGLLLLTFIEKAPSAKPLTSGAQTEAAPIPNEIYLKRSDKKTIYQLEKYSLADFGRPREEFRDHRPFNELNASELARITVTTTTTGAHETFTLTPINDRNNHRWLINGSIAASENTSQWIQHLLDIHIVSFSVSDEKKNGAAPEISIEIQPQHSPTPLKLVVGGAIDSDASSEQDAAAPHYAWLTDRHGIERAVVISADERSRLLKNSSYFKDR